MTSARHDPMNTRFYNLLAEFCDGIADRRPLGVAVSGGSDSLGLLYGLVQTVGAGRVVALTVDHGLRAASADEARQVKSLCRRIGVRHQTLVWEGDKPQTGVQAAARTARYHLLGQAAQQLGLAAVLTGHTRDDQHETLVMRRARGLTELAPGLAGIPQASLFDGRMWVLRPLLQVRRTEIRDILKATGVAWIEDPSNRELHYERVRVRTELQTNPALELDVGEQRAIAERFRLAQEAADQITTHCRADADRTVRIRLHPDSATDAVKAAIIALIDVLGGASRPLDRRGKTTLEAFVVGSRDQPAITVGRTVLRRERGELVVRRERRGLENREIPAGAYADWDGRFRVHNLDRNSSLMVSAGQSRGVSPLFSRDYGQGSKNWRLDEQVVGGFCAEALIGRYSRILPVYEAPLARAIAQLLDTEPFPSVPGAIQETLRRTCDDKGRL
ncbi:tRNA lysidine(34) synthetase TilS [Hoeflea sp. G2-23]|uniref:tRNA(Ile)-lysidine synthase n=1 Tax=Hoeflea algicola TaxID=2983763 RepID=A0ABT3ZAD1_9HYPH|nr:tRNA lysidine(34) synthetase TilS [Hoeflea algicola]MCY0148206.1 tRNA lysidine(34) synthetase TilS [Hoeflea algicola]